MNTCKTCKHWGDETGEEKRQCVVIDGTAHLDAAARELRTLYIGGMWTAPYFGCIYHKPKEETREIMNTCDTCKHWMAKCGYDVSLGDCSYQYQCLEEFNGTLGVGPKFGCIHHEPRKTP